MGAKVSKCLIVRGVPSVLGLARKKRRKISYRETGIDPGAPVYYFLERREADRLTLASERTNGGARAVLVFTEEAAAEAFLILEGLGPGWRAIGHGNRDAAALLEECVAQGVRRGALNPPTVLTRGEEELSVVPIGVLVDHLRKA